MESLGGGFFDLLVHVVIFMAITHAVVVVMITCWGIAGCMLILLREIYKYLRSDG